MIARRPRLARASLPWLMLASIGAGALNYSYSLALAGILPAHQYSVFASGQALLLITGTVANAAVPWLLARELARGGDSNGVVWFAFVLNLGEGLIAGAGVTLIALGFTDVANGLWIGLATVGFFVASTGMGWAQGYERFGLLACLILGEVAIKVIVGVPLALDGAGAAGPFIAALAGGVAIFVVMLRPMAAQLAPNLASLRQAGLWRQAIGMGAIQATVTAMSVADVLLVAFRFGTDSRTAAYQVAATAARTPLFIAIALATQAFPALARRPGSHVLVSAYQARLISVFAPLLIMATTLPVMHAAHLLPATYSAAVRYIPITSVTGTAYALVIFQTTVLRAGGQVRATMAVLGVGTAVSVLTMLVGSELGVMGLGVGAALGGWLTVAGLSLLIERVWPGAQRPGVRQCVVWLGVACVMAAARVWPVAWVIGAVALCPVVGYSALRPAAEPVRI
jgi:O-antigen/teichoic acid export membrane protein